MSPTSSPQISVLGSANMDLVINTPRIPLAGETLTGSDFRTVPGGKGANQAIAAARSGADVSFLGRVGDDDFGKALSRGLAEEGINLSGLLKTEQTASGVAVIMVEPSGQNRIILSPGANGMVTPKDVESCAEIIAKSQMLICQLEIPLESVVRGMEIAAGNNVPVLFNPAPAVTLEEALLRKVNTLVVNETEAEVLCGIPADTIPKAEEAAKALMAKGPDRVLLTMGAQGVIHADHTENSHWPARKVKAVDTTAAGDTFIGAWSASICSGHSTGQALSYACRASALSVTRYGARTSIPSRDEVERI